MVYNARGTLRPAPSLGLPIESAMSEFLDLVSDMPPPFNMAVLIVAIGCGMSLLSGIVKQVRIFADNEADRRLKREMIDNGLSVEEAERIAAMKIKHGSTATG